MSNYQNILLVGSGKMGSAMLGGWEKQGVNLDNIIVIDPGIDTLAYNCQLVSSLSEVPNDFKPEIIVFAIKPQLMADIAKDYQKYKQDNAVFLSIAAGKSINVMEEYLGSDAKIVRAMPNLPALISKGVSVLISNKNVDQNSKDKCTNLISAIGNVYWIDDEELMDAVTAISGSGPAYVFHFVECLIQSAQELGLPEDLSKLLAYQVVNGSINLAIDSEDSASTLRENVTSPGGTTEAALKVLMSENGLNSLLKKATQEATKRSKELN